MPLVHELDDGGPSRREPEPGRRPPVRQGEKLLIASLLRQERLKLIKRICSPSDAFSRHGLQHRESVVGELRRALGDSEELPIGQLGKPGHGRRPGRRVAEKEIRAHTHRLEARFAGPQLGQRREESPRPRRVAVGGRPFEGVGVVGRKRRIQLHRAVENLPEPLVGDTRRTVVVQRHLPQEVPPVRIVRVALDESLELLQPLHGASRAYGQG